MQRHHVDTRLTAGEGTSPRLLRPELRRTVLCPVYAQFKADGLTAGEIAERLGISRSMVYLDLAALGLSPGRNAAPKHLGRAAEVSARVRKARTAARAEKVCPRCPERGPQLLSAFVRNRSTADGYSAYCRECANAYRRGGEHRAKAGTGPPAAGRKTCYKCGLEKDLDDFAPGQRLLGAGWCRACRAESKSFGGRENAITKAALEARAEEVNARLLPWRTPQPTAVHERDCCYGNGNGQHDPACPHAGRHARQPAWP